MRYYPRLNEAILNMRDEHGKQMFDGADLDDAERNLLGASFTPDEMRIAENVLRAWHNYGRFAL